MRFCFVAALFCVPVLLHGQGEPQSAVVAGLVVDSIRGRALSGALVSIQGTELNAVTGPGGYFRITGVPAREYRLEVVHPFLDTLRLTLRTTPRRSNGGDSAFVAIATPSAATVVNLKCGADGLGQRSAMALGFVMEAGTEEPAEGARVSVGWTDYSVKGKKIERTEQERSGSAGPDGSYKVCGVPDDLVTGLVAVRGADTTATVTTSFQPRLAIVSFHVAPPSAPAARLTGRVVDSAGRAIAGARVSSENESASAISREDGTFELAGLRPGTRALIARKIGFLPVSYPVNVEPDVVRNVEIQLATLVPVLETVRITARRELSLERVGFGSRRRSGNGRFLSPEEIGRRDPYRLNDLLVMIPPLRTQRNEHGEEVLTGRNGDCVRYFVDGHIWLDPEESPNVYISGRELGAVEVYSGLTAPPQFSAMSPEGRPCTAVVIWTKWKLRM